MHTWRKLVEIWWFREIIINRVFIFILSYFRILLQNYKLFFLTANEKLLFLNFNIFDKRKLSSFSQFGKSVHEGKVNSFFSSTFPRMIIPQEKISNYEPHHGAYSRIIGGGDAFTLPTKVIVFDVSPNIIVKPFFFIITLYFVCEAKVGINLHYWNLAQWEDD